MRFILSFVILIALSALAASAQKPVSNAQPEVKPSPAAAAKLPPAKDIIDKYVKAIGGKEAIQKHKSRVQTGTMELSPMGVKGTIESYARSDERSFVKVSLAGIGDLLDGYDGKTAWTSNPIQGNRVKEGKELLQSKRTAAFGREWSLDQLYTTLTVRGVEKVGDRDTYVVVGSTEGLPDDIMYFDTGNGLMLRSDSIVISPEGQQATNTFYEDYRDVEGVKSAHKIRAKTPAFEIVTTINETKYNVPIEDSKFVQPK
jgi:zinc protease